MTHYTATFSTGLTIMSKRAMVGPSVHAWLAAGALRDGRAWHMHGFSTSSTGALARLVENTRHLPRSGGSVTLQEIVPATVVKERVTA